MNGVVACHLLDTPEDSLLQRRCLSAEHTCRIFEREPIPPGNVDDAPDVRLRARRLAPTT